MSSVVVDADGHVFEPSEVWVDRMEKAQWGVLLARFGRAGGER
jgi:hypothetical protein